MNIYKISEKVEKCRKKKKTVERFIKILKNNIVILKVVY